MAVQTPSYWQEEQYQPLVEAKTINNNTVLIPKLFVENWEMHSRQQEYLKEMWQRAVQGGFLQETSRSERDWGLDLMKVFLEVYKE